MQKAVENFLFGLCFGVGFQVASGVCHVIGAMLVNAHM